MTTATQEFTGTFTADPYHSSFLFAVQHRAGLDRIPPYNHDPDRGLSPEPVRGRARAEGGVEVGP